MNMFHYKWAKEQKDTEKGEKDAIIFIPSQQKNS